MAEMHSEYVRIIGEDGTPIVNPDVKLAEKDSLAPTTNVISEMRTETIRNTTPYDIPLLEELLHAARAWKVKTYGSVIPPDVLDSEEERKLLEVIDRLNNQGYPEVL